MLWSDAEGLLFVVMMESKGLVVGRRGRWIYRNSILFPSGVSPSLALPLWWEAMGLGYFETPSPCSDR
jgi:hypothetical protein